MSRPASLRPSSSPILAKTKQVGGKKLELDWDHIELSENHRENNKQNNLHLARLRRELISAENDDRQSAAKKIRREISRTLENQLAIHHTWCGSCLNYLHNCRCETSGGSRSTKYRRRKNIVQAIDILHSILHDRKPTGKELRAAKRELKARQAEQRENGL